MDETARSRPSSLHIRFQLIRTGAHEPLCTMTGWGDVHRTRKHASGIYP